MARGELLDSEIVEEGEEEFDVRIEQEGDFMTSRSIPQATRPPPLQQELIVE